MKSFEKNECLSASVAVILFLWFFSSKRIRRSRLDSESFEHYSVPKSMLQALFWAKTSLYVFPENGDFPVNKIWKMTPTENISQIGSHLAFRSLMLTISGATYPGVPHRTKRYSGSSAQVASPKSAITQS